MSWTTWATTMLAGWFASARTSAEESAPPEQAISVRRSASRTDLPPVRRRQDEAMA